MGNPKRNRPVPGKPPALPGGKDVRPNPAHDKITLSFEQYDPGARYCLSECDREQVRTFLDCLRKISERTWQQVFESSSKNPADKRGLNSTPYARSALRNPEIWPEQLGRDVTLYGMRATDRRRIFGFRRGNAFHVLWFAEDHSVVQG